MKKQPSGIFHKICGIVGIVILMLGIFVMIFWQWNIHTSQQRTANYVHTLYTLIPEPQGAIPEEQTNNMMPTLSLDGINFVGILELPRYGSSLPVCNDWGTPSKYPCRFSGSIYDGTMQIGGTSQSGQYDFYREISVGDTFYFTDMAGNRFTYAVTDLHYEEHADQDALHREDAALTLFIKNVYGLDYITVFCNMIT